MGRLEARTRAAELRAAQPSVFLPCFRVVPRVHLFVSVKTWSCSFTRPREYWNHCLTLFPTPLLKLLFQMVLELLEAVPEIPPTPPAPQVPVQIPGLLGLPPRVVQRQREVGHVDEEGRVEGVVVLAVLDLGRVHVARQDVDVQVGHARLGVDADDDLPRPVAAAGQPVSRIELHVRRNLVVVAVQDRLPRRVRPAVVAEAAAQLAGYEGLELPRLGEDFGPEVGVLEGVERVHEVVLGGAREQEGVDGGLGEQVVDHYKVRGVVDDPR